MPRPKGLPKTGGRQPGTPNKATKTVREVIATIAEGRAYDFELWLLRTAEGDPANGVKPDPKGAADLYLKAIEYHIPKLARTELTGKDGQELAAPQFIIQPVTTKKGDESA